MYSFQIEHLKGIIEPIAQNKRWYYHALGVDNVAGHNVHTGYTGGLVVVTLIILLTIYSLRRLWVVWAEILNFDGVGLDTYFGPSMIN